MNNFLTNIKKNSKIILSMIIIVIILISVIIYKKYSTSNKTVSDSILGCYVYTNEDSTYSLDITSQKWGSVWGTLIYNIPDNRGSSGTIKGKYMDGILIADYLFQSDSVNSSMQVAFKKQGSDFLGGYEKNNSNARFNNLNDIIYDSSGLFKATKDNCATSL